VGSRLQWCSEHGSKIDEIIKLVRSIVSEKKEKVLIFAQCSRNEDPRTKRPGNAQKRGSKNEDSGTKHPSTKRPGNAQKRGSKNEDPRMGIQE
jgi:hypothetical protein